MQKRNVYLTEMRVMRNNADRKVHNYTTDFSWHLDKIDANSNTADDFIKRQELLQDQTGNITISD